LKTEQAIGLNREIDDDDDDDDDDDNDYDDLPVTKVTFNSSVILILTKQERK
jgi:hypothetical protein